MVDTYPIKTSQKHEGNDIQRQKYPKTKYVKTMYFKIQKILSVLTNFRSVQIPSRKNGEFYYVDFQSIILYTTA